MTPASKTGRRGPTPRDGAAENGQGRPIAYCRETERGLGTSPARGRTEIAEDACSAVRQILQKIKSVTIIAGMNPATLEAPSACGRCQLYTEAPEPLRENH